MPVNADSQTIWASIGKLEAVYNNSLTRAGTAFVVSRTHVMTAAHCVCDEGTRVLAKSVTVRFPSEENGALGAPLDCQLVTLNHHADLALLKVTQLANRVPLLLHPPSFRPRKKGKCVFRGILANGIALVPPEQQVPFSIDPGHGIPDAIHVTSPLGDVDASGLSGSPVLIDGMVYGVLKAQHQVTAGVKTNVLSAVPVHHLADDLASVFAPTTELRGGVAQAVKELQAYLALISNGRSATTQVTDHVKFLRHLICEYQEKFEAEHVLLIDLGNHRMYPEPYFRAMKRNDAVVAISNPRALSFSDYFYVNGNDRDSPVLTMSEAAADVGVVVHRIFYLEARGAARKRALAEAEQHARRGVLTYQVDYSHVEAQGELMHKDFAVFDCLTTAVLVKSDNNQRYAGLLTQHQKPFSWLRSLKGLVDNGKLVSVGRNGDVRRLRDDLDRLQTYYGGAARR